MIVMAKLTIIFLLVMTCLMFWMFCSMFIVISYQNVTYSFCHQIPPPELLYSDVFPPQFLLFVSTSLGFVQRADGTPPSHLKKRQ